MPLQDAYGNYQAGLEPGPSLPSSVSRLRSGAGAPSNDLGNVGDAYVNISNGDIYTKKNTGWELQSGGGGGGSNNLIGSGSPVGVETPDYSGQHYFDTAGAALWVATGLTSADWLQLI